MNIPYPRQATEFEVQAFLIWELRKLGYDVRGEVPTACQSHRYDLVIFVARRACFIIEVKKCPFTGRIPKGNAKRKFLRISQQLDKYRSGTGLPVVCVRGSREARDFLARVGARVEPHFPAAHKD